jgi:hypothetical protein
VHGSNRKAHLISRSSDGHSKPAVLIAGVIALLGLTVAATTALGGWDGGSRLECAHSTVHECVYDEPDTSITGGPTGYTNDTTPSFGVTSNQDDVGFTCRIDDVRLAKCGPAVTLDVANGPHSFSVLARSNGHTPDSTPATRNFIVDTTPPVTTITAGPSGLTNDNTPSFAYHSNELGSTFQCRVDASAYGPCATPLSHLSDGHHTFFVRAIDRAHNVDATPASRAFTVDTVAPSTNLTGGPTGVTNDRTPSFSFSSEPGATFQCKVDGGAFGNCSSPWVSSPRGDGSHTFFVRAVDGAGNMDASPASRSFVVDATAPNTTITSGPSGVTTDTTPTFAFKSTESGGSFQCKLDGGPLVSCNSPRTTPVLANGGHTFSVRATDNAGNSDLTPAVRSFTVKRSR